MQYRSCAGAGKCTSKCVSNIENPLLTGFLCLCCFVLFQDGHTQCTTIGYDLGSYYKRRFI